MVGGFVKYFGVAFEYVLYEMSWANIQMYNASIPDYSPKKEKKGLSWNEMINKAKGMGV